MNRKLAAQYVDPEPVHFSLGKRPASGRHRKKCPDC